MCLFDGHAALPGGFGTPEHRWSGLSEITTVATAELGPADSPRHDDGGAERDGPPYPAPDDPLPPLVVHRPSMRVVDGTRRLRAALRRGQPEVRVRFLDGPPEDAFVFAVEANNRYGAPLSPAERRTAAARILRSHPHWSDRAIASVTRLSAKTVGGLRHTLAEPAGKRSFTLGRDGRKRPVSSAEGRELAGRLIAENPEASLRDIAARAGISPGTVRDVRRRLARGESPLAGDTRTVAKRGRREPPGGAGAAAAETGTAAYQALFQDPELRVTAAGRLLLRLLEAHPFDAGQWSRIADSVPSDRVDAVSAVAESYADAWHNLATRLKEGTAAPAPRREAPCGEFPLAE
ncbi:winged helix-turn-helix transcriptional regulator [Streptomyces sp. LP05-1]|uniref:Winged helix-turn-helix transcriptional regulator n=1 Tax=Streptomyces pyxinae TaxID=2970734 RepID=A0ABT2CKW0_9ACTN|nr:winged helix-turn-helix transcriptional regulator [Streptomyces sp. LP05-1]MCS0638058.1 winged helix-turn-helix transcriptional regulator [Streptomyces sp. LP05-1]